MKDCITMVNESEFHDNNSQWAAFEKDKDAYLKWLETTIEKAEPIEKRSHGFRYRGQYKNRSPRPWKSQRKANAPKGSNLNTRRLKWRH